ncbi:MAG: lactate utilization protein [Rhizobiaceae bacterium]
MNAREAILAKIKSQVKDGGDDTQRRAAVANRLSSAPKGVIPERGQVTAKKRADLFCQKAEAVQSTVKRVTSYTEISAAISDYLRQKNLPQKIRLGEDERFDAIDWSATPNLTRDVGPTDGSDPVGVSHAHGGVAETGTLLMTSGAANPTTLNFLPENHIIVVKAKDIEGNYEAALARIRDDHGKGRMPRTVNMITGPSRSGDIEQKILLGAHGPRSLHVIVVDG